MTRRTRLWPPLTVKDLSNVVITGGAISGVSGVIGAVTVDNLPLSNLNYAHRGSGRDGRPCGLEGAASSYRMALALGANILDGDVRRTRDGVLVVGFHDLDTSATSDVTVTASQTALRHLSQHYQPALVGSGFAHEDFVSVEAFLAEFGGRAVIDLELKNGAADVADLAALVKRYGLTRSVLVNTSSATDAAAITAAGLLLHFFNCRTNAHIDTAAANGAWLIDVAVDASTALVDYAVSKGFHRILGGFVDSLGNAVSTNTYAQLTGRDARLNGHAHDALGYLFRTGGVNQRSADSISGAIRVGCRGAGWKVVNSGNLTDWLSPGNLYLRKGAGVMVYTFGDLSGTPATTMKITAKFVYDVLPTTLTQSVRLKLFSPAEDPANASANSVDGYILGLQADGTVFLNTLSGGVASAVFANIAGAALVAGNVYTVTVEIDDTTPGVNKIRVTRVDTAGTSGFVTEGAHAIWRGNYHSAYGGTLTDGQARITDLAIS